VIWHLTQPELVLPYDLILAGYPESASGEHHLVARVTCTAYTSRICETDSTPNITASNKQTRAGYVALSRDLLAPFTPGAPFDFGDRIELIGLGTFQVEDTMAERWERRVDIWFPDLDAAWQWGRRSALLAGLVVEPEADSELADPCRLAAIVDPAGDVALLDTQADELGDI
jgi:3D (Asp-Asp-Asp) domain-containing protein